MNPFITKEQHTKPFNAAFGHISLIASIWNKGFVVGKYRKLTRRQSYEGVLLSGPTGSGKTSRYLLKLLATLKNCSLLINDPQGELLHYGSGSLTKRFNHIYSINFSGEHSAGYNPFSRIRKPNDVNKLASLLVSHTLDKGTGGDPFWSLASINLTTVLIRILRFQSVEYHNLCNLIRLLHFFAVDQEKVDRWVVQTRDEKLILDYKSIIATPEKTLQNIVASVKAALQVFDDPQIARTTAFDTIDFDQLRKEPTAIFINSSLTDARYLSVLNAIFFDQFYGYVLERLPTKSDLDIFVILEECPTLYIPNLATATSTSRKAKCGTYAVVQSHNQLKTLYKSEAETIKSNLRTKIWLTGQTSVDELREIETLSGKRIYKDEKGTERTVPLIAADAIRMLPENRSLILSGNHPLIWAKSSQFHRSVFFRRYSKLPPAPITTHISDTPIQLLT